MGVGFHTDAGALAVAFLVGFSPIGTSTTTQAGLGDPVRQLLAFALAAALRLPKLQQAVAAGDWAGAEAVFNQLLADKSKEFWNLTKLRTVFRTDRNPSFREILQCVFGLTPEIADRAHLATEHFERYLATQPVDATKIRETRQVFHAFVLDGDIRQLIEQGNYAEVRARDAGLFQSIKILGADGIPPLLTYIRAAVPLDDFVRVA